jgi:hypothetical protein
MRKRWIGLLTLQLLKLQKQGLSKSGEHADNAKGLRGVVGKPLRRSMRSGVGTPRRGAAYLTAHR